MKFTTIFKLLVLTSIMTMISVVSAVAETTERTGFSNIPEGYQLISDIGTFGDHESASSILVPDNLAGEFKDQFNYLRKANRLSNIKSGGKEKNKKSFFIQVPNSHDPGLDARHDVSTLVSANTKFGSNITKLWNKTSSEKVSEIYGIQDLSGDGLDDVLVLLRFADMRYRLVVLKGTDGNELWNMSVTSGMNISWNIVSDLDGDGIGDVLVTTSKITITSPYSSITDYEIFAKKGNNGLTLWNDSHPGSDFVFTSVLPYSINDLDGDNLIDVIITKNNIDMMTGKSDLIIKAYKGTDKTLLWSDVTNVKGSVFGSVVSFGDLNKDGIADVLIEKMKSNALTGAISAEITARIGKNGVKLWKKSEKSEKGFAYTLPFPVGDVSGDGTLDILLDTIANKLNGSTKRSTRVVKGNDGSSVWMINDFIMKGWQSGMVVPLYYDLNSDGFTDLFYSDYRKVSSNDYVLNISMLQAKNGESLWTEILHGKKNQRFVWPDLVSNDMNGDTYSDVLMTYYNNGNVTIKLKRGDTGDLIWQVPFKKSNSKELIDVYPEPIQDINGDGLMDLFVQILRSKSGSMSDTVQARIGKNGTLKWKDSIKGNTSYLYAWNLDDINGDGVRDFLINGQGTNSTMKTYRYKVKNGKTGSNIWSGSVSYPLASTYGEMFALPSGDLRGNGINTTLIYSNPAKNKFSLTARTGPTGENLWKITSNKRFSYFETLSNFNGDAKDDILFLTSRDIYAITTK